MRRQSGQSMTEFAAGSALLVLLLLGALSLGGYQEADRRIVIAARQSAWQQSWLPAADAPTLARQLHAAVDVRRGGGTGFALSFEPLEGRKNPATSDRAGPPRSRS